jgi:predicted TIM-barrel fold metal-dependent hydrolase
VSTSVAGVPQGLVLAGVFDRFPDLQIVIGHWGELVLFYLERIEWRAHFIVFEPPLVAVRPPAVVERVRRYRITSNLRGRNVATNRR